MRNARRSSRTAHVTNCAEPVLVLRGADDWSRTRVFSLGRWRVCPATFASVRFMHRYLHLWFDGVRSDPLLFTTTCNIGRNIGRNVFAGHKSYFGLTELSERVYARSPTTNRTRHHDHTLRLSSRPAKLPTR